ncbi:MAG: aldo/keto reductase [Candidatus Humimicrobiaceae bacterium]
MIYREFGKTGKKVSILGFGAMRLPETNQSGEAQVDFEKSINLMLKAFDYGINYVDTAYPYCYGQSEIAVGKALKETNKKIYVSTKSPVWRIEKKGDFRYYLEESLKKLDLGTIDFYHFHSLNEHFYKEKILKFNLIEEAEKAREEKLINHISFSFHDRPEVLKQLVDTGAFDSLLCQYNFLDRTNEEAISHAKDKGVGVAVMGPLAGGRLLNLGTENIVQEAGSNILELALQFVFGNSNVSVALSGMENIEMLGENVGIASNPISLSEMEAQVLGRISGKKEIKDMVPCNDCGYCIPCPNNIPIPRIFKIMNYCILTGVKGNSSWQYSLIGRYDDKSKADECVECGECEEKCPQDIEIIEQLKKGHKLLSR